MENATLVIDMGTSTTRAGIGGDSEPMTTLSTVLGRPRASSSYSDEEINFFIGSNVYKNTSTYSIHYPMSGRSIKDFDDFATFLHTLVTGHLNTSPGGHPLLLTVSPTETQENREALLQIIFETFKFPAFYPASPNTLALYASGTTTGIVVDSGESGTYIMPIFESYSIPYYSERLDVGGRHVTDILRKALIQRGYSLRPGTERDVLSELKSQICYIAEDPTRVQDVPVKAFVTSDGLEIRLTSQAFLAPEVLFKPSMAGCSQKGTALLLADVLSRVDEDIRPALAQNIVLAGGSTLFPGYPERIERALEDTAASLNLNRSLNYSSFSNYSGGGNYRSGVRVVADSGRAGSIWVGGSIFASLSTFSQLYISRDEYEEEGTGILQLKMY
ncbi:actin [Tritrichomonas foetus]|uniref:Actin n=1 Tax=Tritrichomonas foetus TaxID=1144522 RepID=A0A1J4JCR8_9EUKA|nr:actin [Tritrichomonas foetus]|eukprot:OHS96974.1 actin [Tritrichomonas foetus]